jgi:serine/threonine protein kinase
MPDVTKLNGEKIDDWILEEPLGQGADGVVYRASNCSGEFAAVKIFLPQALQKNGWTQAKERLEFQLQLQGRKHHPNLVQIYGGGDCPQFDSMYLVMEIVPGTSLDQLSDAIPPAQIPNLLRQLASVAQFLEESLNLFHRDIKPANIIVSDDLKHLTLLDLGIVHKIPTAEDPRISGEEFVASLRYSPPEFVWRQEEGDQEYAWRAITFYQIGATLHDMMTGKRIFDGQDKPHAKLYDCVRNTMPYIPELKEAPWLTPLAQSCLLKNWRDRLRFVRWDSFSTQSNSSDFDARERNIQLKQAIRQQERLAAARENIADKANYREQELWKLNSELFGEIRTYLLDSSVAPRFRVTESESPGPVYKTRFTFDTDEQRDFKENLVMELTIQVAPITADATKMQLLCTYGSKELVSATWTEMFTIESAFHYCREGFLGAVEQVLQ